MQGLSARAEGRLKLMASLAEPGWEVFLDKVLLQPGAEEWTGPGKRAEEDTQR